MRKLILLSLLLLSGFGIIHSYEGSEEETVGLLQISMEKNPKFTSNQTATTSTPLAISSPLQKVSQPWSKTKKAVIGFTALLVATSLASDSVALVGRNKINDAAGPYTTYPYTIPDTTYPYSDRQPPNITHKPHCTYTELEHVKGITIPYSAKGSCGCGTVSICWCTLEECSMQPNEYDAYNYSYKLVSAGAVAGLCSRLILLAEAALFGVDRWLC